MQFSLFEAEAKTKNDQMLVCLSLRFRSDAADCFSWSSSWQSARFAAHFLSHSFLPEISNYFCLLLLCMETISKGGDFFFSSAAKASKFPTCGCSLGPCAAFFFFLCQFFYTSINWPHIYCSICSKNADVNLDSSDDLRWCNCVWSLVWQYGSRYFCIAWQMAAE